MQVGFPSFLLSFALHLSLFHSSCLFISLFYCFFFFFFTTLFLSAGVSDCCERFSNVGKAQSVCSVLISFPFVNLHKSESTWLVHGHNYIIIMLYQMFASIYLTQINFLSFQNFNFVYFISLIASKQSGWFKCTTHKLTFCFLKINIGLMMYYRDF